MIHELKTLPGYFKMTIEGRKKFEVRKNDRPFQPGDYVALNEWGEKGYTGRSALFEVTCVFCDKEYCKEGYVILGLEPCAVKAHGAWKGMETYGRENMETHGREKQLLASILGTMLSCMAAQKQSTVDGKENGNKEKVGYTEGKENER